jgi:hypothetical protein
MLSFKFNYLSLGETPPEKLKLLLFYFAKSPFILSLKPPTAIPYNEFTNKLLRLKTFLFFSVNKP